MSTFNIILMSVFIALISIIFGYSVGKQAGKDEIKRTLEQLMTTFNKFGETMKKDYDNEHSNKM